MARKYIDDHIEHDAQKHFPDLLRVLQKSEAQQSMVDSIKERIDIIFNARLKFFEGISAC